MKSGSKNIKREWKINLIEDRIGEKLIVDQESFYEPSHGSPE